MNVHNLKTVATYNSKLLRRSWLFRFFAILMFCVITGYQLVWQSNLILHNSSGLITLSSFIPYMNAYLFTNLLVVPLCFLAGMFLGKEKNTDSMDAIYYRPESNAEYILGILWAMVVQFTRLAVLMLCVGVVIHLFATKAPFSGGVYLFYGVTMIFPALVFLSGFSFFIHSWVRHRALSILILLVFGGVFVWGTDFWHGLFDPLGTTLPNVFSKVTGHPGMAGYLLQRGCWLFVGFGFMGLAILSFKRLANSPFNRVRVLGITLGLLGVGLLLGTTVFMIQEEKDGRREVYAEAYNRYVDVPKGSVVRHDIQVRQEGDRLEGRSSLVLRNKTAADLAEVVLYLNPELEVAAIREEGKDLAYERDHQVIRVKRSVPPGAEVGLQVEYGGGIDPLICYLDVPDEALYNSTFHRYSSCRYGKDFALLRDDYTLLIPECLWYPVAVPPVNPRVSYDISKDFTIYTLHVSGAGGKSVLSQGEREERGDGVSYRNDIALPGISLCMGEFEKRSVTVDSLACELYLFKGHGKLLDGLEVLQDTLPVIVRDIKEQVEFAMGRSYPYSSFILVETPISFTSFYRNERGGSECVQPGMVFIPERCMGYWHDVVDVEEYRHVPAQIRSRMTESPVEERYARSVESSLLFLLQGDRKFDMGTRDILRGLFPALARNMSIDDINQANNLYNIYPMFLNYTISFRSEQYPVMDAVLHSMMRRRFKPEGYSLSKGMLRYLDGHSMKDAFYDELLSPVFLSDLLNMKSIELLRWFALDRELTDEVVDFIREYVYAHSFEQVDFDDFNRELAARFDKDLKSLLAGWYSRDRLATLWIDGFVVETIGEGAVDFSKTDFGAFLANHKEGEELRIPGLTPCRVRARAKVYNDSDVDGLITFTFNSQNDVHSSTRHGRRVNISSPAKSYVIPARSGKEIVVLSDNEPSLTKLETNFSRHLPNSLDKVFNSNPFTLDTTVFIRDIDKSYFLPKEGEMIVDNEDAGFTLIGYSRKSFIQDLFNKTVRDKYDTGQSGAVVDKGKKVEPGYYIDPHAYGYGVRSAAYMDEGSGASMEWQTRVEREGEYDVYVHVPAAYHVFRLDPELMSNLESSINMGRVAMSSGSLGQAFDVKQFYRVVNGGEEYEATAEVGMAGDWALLGRFRLSPGDCKVILSDRGEAEQVLVGDAVKWVYVGDK